jgi:hypothetical protein
MNIELQTSESTTQEESLQYQFVIDADLIHVGGGTGLLDY